MNYIFQYFYQAFEDIAFIPLINKYLRIILFDIHPIYIRLHEFAIERVCFESNRLIKLVKPVYSSIKRIPQWQRNETLWPAPVMRVEMQSTKCTHFKNFTRSLPQLAFWNSNVKRANVNKKYFFVSNGLNLTMQYLKNFYLLCITQIFDI